MNTFRITTKLQVFLIIFLDNIFKYFLSYGKVKTAEKI
jgi:hypothetical protein